MRWCRPSAFGSIYTRQVIYSVGHTHSPVKSVSVECGVGGECWWLWNVIIICSQQFIIHQQIHNSETATCTCSYVASPCLAGQLHGVKLPWKWRETQSIHFWRKSQYLPHSLSHTSDITTNSLQGVQTSIVIYLLRVQMKKKKHKFPTEIFPWN